MSDSSVIADIIRPDVDEDGVPVANVGEQSTGLGFGADTTVWGNGDGFISVPNPPSAAGAAQAIVEQDGNVKRATQTRDQRWVTKAGTLAPGDRAVVTDADAWIKITKATGKIEIVAGSMRVEMDPSNLAMTISNGVLSKITMTNGQVIVGELPPLHGQILTPVLYLRPSTAPIPGVSTVLFVMEQG